MEKSTIFDTLDRKAQDSQNLQSKLNTLENDILSTIKTISEDLRQNSAKIDFLEKKQNDNFNETKNQIMDINNKLLQFQNEFNALNKFKDNSNENFAGMANDIFHHKKMLDSFNEKIREQLNNFESISEKNNIAMNSEITKIIKMKEEIYKNIEIINSKTINEINKFIEDINSELKNNKNEISMLEKHITEEQKNLINRATKFY